MSSKPWFDYFIMKWSVSDDKSPVESIKFLTAVFLRNFMIFHDSLYNIDTEFTRWLVGLVTKISTTQKRQSRNMPLRAKEQSRVWGWSGLREWCFRCQSHPCLEGFSPSSLVFISLKNHGSVDSPKLEISLRIVETSPLKSLKAPAGNFWIFSLKISENFHLKFSKDSLEISENFHLKILELFP